MSNVFTPAVRRYISLANALLLIWSLGWSVSADALSDWLWVETTEAYSVAELPTVPASKMGMKTACNGGCVLFAQLQCLWPHAVAIPPISWPCIWVHETPSPLTSIFADPPYHPPRSISCSRDD